MDTELTNAARIQLARSLRQRYQAASSRATKQILSEFIAVSGYHPKYAVQLLNSAGAGARARRRRVRPTIYDEAAKQALIVLWESSDRVCGKRLKPLLSILVPALERPRTIREHTLSRCIQSGSKQGSSGATTSVGATASISTCGKPIWNRCTKVNSKYERARPRSSSRCSGQPVSPQRSSCGAQQGIGRASGED